MQTFAVITWLVAEGRLSSWLVDGRTSSFKHLNSGEEGSGVGGGSLVGWGRSQRQSISEMHGLQVPHFPFLSSQHCRRPRNEMQLGWHPEFFPTSWSTRGWAPAACSLPSPRKRPQPGLGGSLVAKGLGHPPLISGCCCGNPTLSKLIYSRKGPVYVSYSLPRSGIPQFKWKSQ